MKKILFLMFIVSSMFGRNFNLQIPLELRPDSGCIIFTNRTHDTLDLDTIAVIDTNGIWHKYGEFSDSLWAKILHGEYGVLDSLLADTIKGYLKGKADSAEYADSADWSDLLDGYNEDYFRDTLDVWRDSLWAYAEATDSFATSKLKADFITPDDSGQTIFTDDVVFDSTIIVNDTIKAKDSGGIGLYDDAGGLGILVVDGGNVGIGTTDPTFGGGISNVKVGITGGKLLIIEDVDWSGIYIGESTSKFVSFNWRNTLERADFVTKTYLYPIAFNGSAIVFQDESGGGVGIGTATPNAKLEVIGNAIIDTNLTVNEFVSIGDSLKIGSGSAITKIIKVGSHLAIILGTDTLWAAKDTTGF